MVKIKVEGLGAFMATSQQGAKNLIKKKLKVKRLPYGMGNVICKAFGKRYY